MRWTMNIETKLQDEASLLAGHLKMGGVNPSGEEINVNSIYLTRGGKPWLPVMGEFHYSRFPEQFWEEELLKMKAGGIQIVATYMFWIHHEEIEGQFRWSRDRDLRRFVQLCGELGLEVVVRIGPWAHGECRNGGFPDWIYGRCALRTNDDDYLYYVRKLYGEIAHQLQGLAYQEGGPIVGFQFENELTDNADHLQMLKEMALEAGMKAPLYTVTGWGGPGGAKIPQDEVLPLFGGYPDHPWEQHTKPLAPGLHYFFHSVRNDPGIGSDMFVVNSDGVIGDLDNIDRYPNGTCELGGGVQITYHRRPVIAADDVGAMAMVRIANGCNLLGYYMYHGGINPVGELSTMQESNAHGNQLPVFSYDFQAPIGEFGFIRESYHYLKRLHLFIGDFGEKLAPMQSVFPKKRPSSFSDNETLRFAVRVEGNSGYLFFNNYQRMTEIQRKDDVQIELLLPGENLKVPAAGFTLEKDAYFFWPFNMDMGGAMLKYATAQPLCILRNDDEVVYVFFETGGVKPEYVLDSESVKDIETNTGSITRQGQSILVNELNSGTDCEVTIRSAVGTCIKLLTLTEKQSLTAWKGNAFGQERLILCESNIVFSDDSLKISGHDVNASSFSIYPPVEYALQHHNSHLLSEQEGSFQTYRPQFELLDIEVTCQETLNQPLNDELFPFLFEENGKEGTAPEWEIRVDVSAFNTVHDIILNIDYIGDVAQVYIAGRCVADHFYNGVPWKLGLKSFHNELKTEALILKISPHLEERDIYMPTRPSGDRIAQMTNIYAEAEFVLPITANHI